MSRDLLPAIEPGNEGRVAATFGAFEQPKSLPHTSRFRQQVAVPSILRVSRGNIVTIDRWFCLPRVQRAFGQCTIIGALRG